MKRSWAITPIAILAALAAACRPQSGADLSPGTEPGEITVYSGRSEELVGPLLEQFENTTGIRVVARYGDTAEMAATILEEGDRSPADIFLAQDAGALGAVARAGNLGPIDPGAIGGVPSRFRARDGSWVGISGRARTVVYHTGRLRAADLPDSIRGFTDPRWKGKIGWAPTNGSFQAFVTALRLIDGEEGARRWLAAIKANEARTYPGNNPIVQAVAAQEIEIGFVNHYYLLNLKKEDPSVAAANYFFKGGDPGGLVNVAGVGILRTTKAKEAARAFVQFLLSEDAQRYFAEQTSEFPLIDGVPAPQGLPTLGELQPPDVDLSDLEDLEGTLRLLEEVGLV